MDDTKLQLPFREKELEFVLSVDKSLVDIIMLLLFIPPYTIIKRKMDSSIDS